MENSGHVCGTTAVLLSHPAEREREDSSRTFFTVWLRISARSFVNVPPKFANGTVPYSAPVCVMQVQRVLEQKRL